MLSSFMHNVLQLEDGTCISYAYKEALHTNTKLKLSMYFRTRSQTQTGKTIVEERNIGVILFNIMKLIAGLARTQKTFHLFQFVF